VDGKLSGKDTGQMISFPRQSKANRIGFDDELFFRNLAYEMTGQVKELASLIIDFRAELKSKIHTELSDIEAEYIPEAADQWEAVIESTEMAANKIVDNLKGIQGEVGALNRMVTSLRQGTIQAPYGEKEWEELILDSQTKSDISIVIDCIEPHIENSMSLISDSFIQMSFQDLSCQMIKRIIGLVSQTEEKIKNMVISFAIKLTERQKNPSLSPDELQRAVEEKVTELASRKKAGRALDQAGIEELLANL
jgi:chemotaxis regulatin CheY-phosphate phosphatase CheZ